MKTQPEQRLLATFTSQQWSGKPVQDAIATCLGLGIIGFLLCVVLALFISGLRNSGAAALFIVLFALVTTTLAVIAKSSTDKKFLIRITERVNDTILELTGNPNNRLSPEDFKTFLQNDKPIPLLVNGVPGLELSAVKEKHPKAASPNQPAQAGTASSKRPAKNEPVITTTRLVIAAIPPDYGTVSFDRLLQAAADSRSRD